MSERRTPPNARLPWLVVSIVLIGWMLYTATVLGSHPLVAFPAFLLRQWPLALVYLAWVTRRWWLEPTMRLLEHHTDHMDGLRIERIGLWIALAAGLGLYTELMIIRLHASYFQLFAYFKNVSLLSCFLGLGIGYTHGDRRPLWTPVVLPALALQILLMHWLHLSGGTNALQNPVSEQFSFGFGGGEGGGVLAAYGFLIFVFALNALCFIPFGHLASRLMARQPKLVAYSWNLAGSLAGILVFYLMSLLWAPPAMWILAAALGVYPFLRSHVNALLPSAVAGAVTIGLVGFSPRINEREVYSPYQRLALTMHRSAPPEIKVTHVYYQRVLRLDSIGVSSDRRLERWANHYNLPYHFKPAPERVLVVGSGTGNDVAAALRSNAVSIDAVEIDPAIVRFGQFLHPESPYQKPNVAIHMTDARRYLKRTPERYDLIVYGLVDSHTLLAGQGAVRLDSYVYTVEGFREARSRLKDGGLITLTFALINTRLGHKLYRMLEAAFDGEIPVVYKTGYDDGYSFIIGERMAERSFPDHPNLENVTAQFATGGGTVDLSTDDWPFFYMPTRKYPLSYVVMVLVLLGVSLIFVRQIVPGTSGLRGGAKISWPCFYLGVGFMLIETKAITELALVFGSTWTVIAAVITGILVMAFLANLLVLKLGAPPSGLTYAMLVATLLGGMVLGPRLTGLTPWLSGVLVTGALTVPVFFSGFAFSTELGRAPSVAVALSSNLLGAMVGGFLEYNSMYFGFRSLYFMALGMYGLAFLSSLRVRAQISTSSPVTGRAARDREMESVAAGS